MHLPPALGLPLQDQNLCLYSSPAPGMAVVTLGSSVALTSARLPHAELQGVLSRLVLLILLIMGPLPAPTDMNSPACCLLISSTDNLRLTHRVT